MPKQPKTKSQKKIQSQLFDASIADGFLFMAMGDLDASILLYHRGHYPQAVFLLQQSVEKAAKSLGIFLSLITAEDTIKIVGHKPLKILEKTTKDMADNIHEMNNEIKVNPEIQLFFNGMGVDFSAFDKSIDSWVDQAFDELKKMDTYDFKRNQIRSILKGIRKKTEQTDIALTKNRDQGLSDEDYNQMKKGLVDKVIAGVSATTLPPSKKTDMINNFQQNLATQVIPDKESLESLLTFLLILGDCVTLLIPLAQLTGPQAIRSRYPMQDEGFDPITYYTKERPIVAFLPDLYPFARRSIEQIDLLYDLMTGEGEGANATSYLERVLLDPKEDPS